MLVRLGRADAKSSFLKKFIKNRRGLGMVDSKHDGDLLSCDLIMKGGTTSGTVYPGAVKEIMKKYHLVNIGGTSAGAIAAAAAAAAEVGRDSGSLDHLDKIPNDFKEGGLLSLFQPRKECRFLFKIFEAWLDSKKAEGERFSSKLTKLWIKEYWLISLLLFGVVFLGGLGFVGLSKFSTAFQILGYFLIVVLIVLAAIGWVIFSIFKTLNVGKTQFSSNHGFGLCPGANQSNSEQQAFTNWFSQHLRKLAGLSEIGRPLTFGDLKRPPNQSELEPINLLILTTSLTEGKMVTLPLEEPNPKGHRYLFREDDWRGKLPDDDLDWMIRSASPVLTKDVGENIGSHPVRDGGFYYLPERDKLPIILAVRMSLSFPFLFTTTKLYLHNKGDELVKEIEFSDGGITSNFPIHFFDNVWPRRPTFAITLTRTDCGHENNLAPRFLKDSRVCSAKRIEDVGGFVMALLTTMQEWTDNQQSELRSATQRIVQIPLTEEEGGLNLMMEAPVIKRLTIRGEEAGQVFADFDWNQHRWTRYVSSIISFAEATIAMRKVWKECDSSGEQSFKEFIKSYPMSPGKVAQEEPWISEAFEFAQSLVASGEKTEIKRQKNHEVKLRIVADKLNTSVGKEQ